MKAARIHQFGGPEAIEIEDVAVPVPAEGQVLVRVQAASVGPWDAWVRAGTSGMPQPLPLTLGSDLAGQVEKLGPDVSGLAVGQDVFGVTNPRFTGAYAEYAVVQASMIAPRPEAIGVVLAAAVPVIAVTAREMVLRHAGVQRGQRVLVNGAAGSVGAFAVQLALRAGADVVAAVRPDAAAYVKSLGVRDVIDSSSDRFEEVLGDLRPVDAVIDTVGQPLQSQSMIALRTGGVLVSSASAPDANLAAQRGIRAHFFIVEVTSAALGAVADLLVKGEATTRLGPRLKLAYARLAHQMLAGKVKRESGKIVLQL
jgi:NADPH:quinone reductase-like Zn-dependent oxidoreductase